MLTIADLGPQTVNEIHFANYIKSALRACLKSHYSHFFFASHGSSQIPFTSDENISQWLLPLHQKPASPLLFSIEMFVWTSKKKADKNLLAKKWNSLCWDVWITVTLRCEGGTRVRWCEAIRFIHTKHENSRQVVRQYLRCDVLRDPGKVFRKLRPRHG